MTCMILCASTGLTVRSVLVHGSMCGSNPGLLEMWTCFPAACSLDGHFVFSVEAADTEVPIDPSALLVKDQPHCLPVITTHDTAVFKIALKDCGSKMKVVWKWNVRTFGNYDDALDPLISQQTLNIQVIKFKSCFQLPFFFNIHIFLQFCWGLCNILPDVKKYIFYCSSAVLGDLLLCSCAEESRGWCLRRRLRIWSSLVAGRWRCAHLWGGAGGARH